ncbi:aminodeoxychorismate synthase component I [Leifsonia sp. NPDC058292]|uniref:aminodeoxychorismate synthase component I n=1 Tax=Leifsonia sp. NPDC058292 TaxID=3346428 RepID=UPI0036DDD900
MAARLRRFPVDGWLDPADAFVALFADAPAAVWLDSGADAVAGRSYLATGDVVATSSVLDAQVRVETPHGKRIVGGTMLDFLRADLAERPRLAPLHPEPSFALGWVGWLGYESGAAEWNVPIEQAETRDASMLFVSRALVFDHERRTVELIAGDGCEGDAVDTDLEAWAAEVRAGLSTASGAAERHRSAHAGPFEHPAPAHWRHGPDEYLGLIAECQESIKRGDAYQLCLTDEASASVDRDALAVHLRLRAASPAHHAGFVRIGDTALVSSSPERFLAVTAEGRVQTKPIKGTRPRGATLTRDLDLRAELEASEKERAENVMIVDLMRNDLGRVCEVGSVEVNHLLAVESYPQVHQLVSTVEGRLLAGLGALDAVAACFPAGSMTGAPKLSAMRILNRLEAGPRGVYAGCFGYFGLDGAADLAMVIRSVVVKPGRLSIGAGGGITASSVPEEEVEEVAVKAAALLAAAGLSADGNGSGRSNV